MTPLDLREAVAANRGCSGDVAASKQFAPSARIDKVCSPPRAVLESLEWEETMGSVASERSETECIRVAARFRPLDQNELQAGEDKLCVRFGRDGKSCALTADTAHGPAETNFAYDFMFQPESTQQDVYQAVARPIVDGVISGFNGAILAYGQTGSGKTHTMLGPGGAAAFLGEKEVDMAEVGVIPRALQDLVGYAATSEGHVKLRASYVEMYMERVIDLLSTRKGGAEASDHLHSAMVRDESQNLHLPEVTAVPITSVREAMEVMKLGNTNRHVAATSMNRQSSRSHAVFVVTVTNTTDENCQKFAQLCLVDLAGSERLQKTNASGKQLEEAKLINTSLLALGQVIAALAHRHRHVPYRDSKLTQLLRNCLGGNARTAVLVAASPHAWNANESLSALRFGARASLITNTAQMNVAQDPEMLKRLLEKARMDLNELRGHCRAMEAKLAAVSAAEAIPAEAMPLLPTIASQCVAGRSSSGADPGVYMGPASEMTGKRLLVWGLLPSLVCPLARAVMRDPVIAADGWTYERTSIVQHLGKASGKIQNRLPLSPVTGERLTSRNLVPNLVVKQLVQQHLPNLAPLAVRLPAIALLSVYLVQEIQSYLNAKSLGRSEAVCTSFHTAASTSQAWAKVLMRDFPQAAIHDMGATPTPLAALAARGRYSELASHMPCAKNTERSPRRKGLTLMKK
eukprot:gnl/TRDRNA2_/TRDRNA2_158183_c0_seq2.p1 gnl/TRDRNA2_/TRDRNA2_158183_c0~~gnl/TRDRNA2_/TRDRNA2_158183_c0_seq2.p1  ORF type:complete len:688 (+),score=100.96 gnl/TRDRNA2_/TRDRNA2_158183_c0_seq2:63-2126(+)